MIKGERVFGQLINTEIPNSQKAQNINFRDSTPSLFVLGGTIKIYDQILPALQTPFQLSESPSHTIQGWHTIAFLFLDMKRNKSNLDRCILLSNFVPDSVLVG